MKIGLTGSIACGKSTVSSFLRKLGYTVIDADAISHALTAPGGDALPAIREAFGDSVFASECLDRRALGRIVFSSSTQRDRLNALLHPMILGSIYAALEEGDAPDALVFADVPLLYECGMEDRFDRIWVVAAEQETQLDRLMVRDSLTREEALARIRSQMPLEEKCRRANAVIHTDGPVEQTQKQVRSLLAVALKRRRV
ncbi:MAG: dephospho-CoA kinase [Clostridia bacterium]|nr:dephospho-CoA kinase [Clostridia bacterium]